MEHDCDILIVGGGLNGPALALAAAKAGLKSIVIDALPEAARTQEDFDGRGYALALSSVRMLDNLGLWERLQPNAQPMREIKVTDGRVGDAQVFLGLHFDSAEIEEGPMGQMVEDRYLRRALLEAMEANPLVEQRAGETVIAQETGPGGISVTLASGETLRARLLVGADGRRSGTAARAGIRRTGWGYGQTALVCAIAHEKPHHGVAHQFFMPPGPLAILPLPGNRSSIVWSETEAQARAINALPDDQYLEVLRPRFGDFLGEISLAGKRFVYPLNLTLANSFIAERLALVGDAAHGMHPIAGQGLNAGLRDVAALAHVLSHAQRRGEDIASPLVLARYQQWRRFDTASLAAATDLFNRLFSNDSALLRFGRDLGMAAINAVPGLRRGFIREAAGITGDLPELMRD
ncbi:2-octaprenyl-6-methoxyphenyl hydroxylase [bacterium]|nr:2-octaprenyl-6-methoxyphenyl hydroxylase [bacterium]